MNKRRYQFFTTTLPDQFVEANAASLIDACKHWQNTNVYIKQAIIIEGVSLSLCGSRKAHTIPMIVSNSSTQINNWMSKYGDNFNGRYWETFAKDNSDSSGKSDPRSTVRTNLPTASWRTLNSVTSTAGKDSSLDLQKVADIYNRQVTHALLYGAGPTIFSSHGLNGLLNDFKGEPRPPLKRESIACGEIIAYRCWLVITANGQPLLRSIYQTDYWLPNQPLEGRGLEDWDSRGIHAWKHPNSEHFFKYIRGYLDNRDLFTRFSHEIPTKPAIVTGTVALWGDIVEHEHGYRAEFARVKSIDWLYPDQSMMGREAKVLAHLRQIYGV